MRTGVIRKGRTLPAQPCVYQAAKLARVLPLSRTLPRSTVYWWRGGYNTKHNGALTHDVSTHQSKPITSSRRCLLNTHTAQIDMADMLAAVALFGHATCATKTQSFR